MQAVGFTETFVSIFQVTRIVFFILDFNITYP